MNACETFLVVMMVSNKTHIPGTKLFHSSKQTVYQRCYANPSSSKFGDLRQPPLVNIHSPTENRKCKICAYEKYVGG